MMFSSDIIERIIETPPVVWWSLLATALILAGSWLVYEMSNPVDLHNDVNIEDPVN